MKLLGLDLETGGEFEKDLSENFITEVGLVLWDTNHGPVKIYSQILDQEKEVSAQAEEYTGISNEVVSEYGTMFLREVAVNVMAMIDECDYIVAHNGLEFDLPVIRAFLSEQLEPSDIERFDLKVWIDTMIDVPYPNNCKSRNLTYLAGFHIILNCFPHRAITDVLTMMTVLLKYSLDDVLVSANSPMVEYVWKQDYPNKRKFNDPKKFIIEMAEFNRRKDTAKANGFRWDADSKLWNLKCRKVKKPEIDLPFVERTHE